METRKDVRPCFGGTFGRLWLVGAGELPFLRELLHTEPLTGLDLLVLFLASTLGTPRYGWTASCSARSSAASKPGRVTRICAGGQSPG